jgi:hypothetical protein
MPATFCYTKNRGAYGARTRNLHRDTKLNLQGRGGWFLRAALD